MKMKKLILTAALAIAATGFVSTTASAQTVSTGATDLILGFQITDTSTPGQNTNLEVDLGAFSSFTTTTSTINLTGLVGADLVATYGASWATRTDLVWSVAGITTTGASKTFDVTSNVANPTERSTNAAPFGFIGALASTLNGQNQTANSTSAATIGDNTTPANTIAGSYSTQVVGSGTGDFGVQSFGVGQSQSSGPLGSLELYGFAQHAGTTTPATDIGTFTLSGSGSSATLTFTGINATAIPEPSSYALGFCGLLLLWVLKRRNSIV